MNKNKMVMAVVGGVAAVVVLGCAVMIWFASDECDEALMEREGAIGECRRAAGISGDDAKTYDKNRETLVAWADELSKFVVENGRRDLDPSQEPAAFKQQMVEDAAYFRALPQETTKKIVKADFDFGFKAYVNEGTMPSKTDLPVLQRKWDDVVRFMGIMLKSGVTEVTSIVDLGGTVAEDSQQNQRGGRKPNKKATPADAYPSTSLSYEITFLAKPTALVATLNALAADKRFITVDSLAFEQAGDPLIQKIGGEKEKESASGGRRGRRRRRAQEEEQQPQEGQEEAVGKGLVTDPSSMIPFTVKIRVSTLDFAAKEEKKK
jgi:hypothetical protein